MLPRLIGIERSIQLRFGDQNAVCAEPDEAHAARLTREAIAASVHYIRIVLTPEQSGPFAAGPVVLIVDHPNYQHETRMSQPTWSSLLEDLREA